MHVILDNEDATVTEEQARALLTDGAIYGCDECGATRPDDYVYHVTPGLEDDFLADRGAFAVLA
jgi:hypothetical protein